MAVKYKALAREIARRVEELDDSLFDPSTGSVHHDADFKSPAGETLELLRRLQFALMGPTDVMHLLIGNLFDLAALQALHRFNVLEALSTADPEPRNYEQLAQACKVDAGMLRRVVRMAALNGLLREPSPGEVEHTRLSRSLAQNAGLKATVSNLCDETFPAGARFADALTRYSSGMTDPTASAWCIANNASHPMMEELQLKYPRRALQFSSLMQHYHAREQPVLALVHDVEWASLGDAQVVDVGGGVGHASVALARAYPNLSFVVQDFALVLDEARASLDPKLGSRVQFMEHNFFHPQPVVGAAVYLFRSVLHNWSDENCITILRQLVPALRPGSRVIINDSCIPPPGQTSVLEERYARSMDLAMAMMLNAREREESEWAPLLRRADDRFRLVDIKTPVDDRTDAPQRDLLKIIQVAWEPDNQSVEDE